MSTPTLSRRGLLRLGLAAVPAWAVWSPAAWALAADPGNLALHAVQRLGYGPAPGDLDRVGRQGVEAWVAEQLEPQKLPLPASLTQALAQLETLQWTQADLIDRYREASRRARAEKQKGSGDGGKHDLVRHIAIQAGEARILRALQSPRQLEELMVEFWFNHFNVFIGKGLCRVLVGHYEQHAIRPHAMGRFRDLLGATARHPAMLFYLDNWMSVANGADLGRPKANPNAKRPSGLNENYARELMELHTLGVDGGYTQRDVTELARIFTGWGINQKGSGDNVFEFANQRHDQGEKQWLGQRVTPRGQSEGEWALDVLAKHPSTARFISRKLAQYFVSDEPPAALVERMAKRFLDTDGDIRAVLRTVLTSAEFLAPAAQQHKFKPPYRYIVSALRAGNYRQAEVRPLLAVLAQMGMPLYGSPTPDGYKYTEAAWLSPGALQARASFATAFSGGRLPTAADEDDADNSMRADKARSMDGEMMDRKARKAAKAGKGEGMAGGDVEAKAARVGDAQLWGPLDAKALLAALGPAISAKTREVVAQTEPQLQAALVLGSPDFMRY